MTSAERSWRCKTCRAKHFFGCYVAAHCTEVLVHTCECGAKHEVLNYHVTQTKAGKAPATQKGKRK